MGSHPNEVAVWCILRQGPLSSGPSLMLRAIGILHTLTFPWARAPLSEVIALVIISYFFGLWPVTGDKGQNTQQIHAEHIENTDNM